MGGQSANPHAGSVGPCCCKGSMSREKSRVVVAVMLSSLSEAVPEEERERPGCSTLALEDDCAYAVANVFSRGADKSDQSVKPSLGRSGCRC